jgi:hypothetical protein
MLASRFRLLLLKVSRYNVSENARFPGAWQNLPREVQQMLAVRLTEKQLVIQDGAAGLIEWLYRGVQRTELVGQPFAHTSGVIHYNASAKDLYALVLEDTKRFHAERSARKAPPSGEAP